MVRSRGALAADGLRRPGVDRLYVLLALLLWLGLLVQTINYQWSSDFRFHTAAIAEFANNLFDPRHVFLPLEIPHHSLSFYHQSWGLFSSITGLSAIATTQVAAMVNATALLVVFPFFVRVFVKRHRAPSVALVLVLLAWGPGAWRLSSLLNLNSLGFGLPYPSYHALWLSMLLIVWIDRITSRQRTPSAAGYLGLAGLGFLVSNAHLISFGSFMVLGAALVLSRRAIVGFHAITAVVSGAAVGAFAWPYYPLLGVADASSVIDDQNHTVYESTFVRLAPSLLGLVPLIRRFRSDRSDPLVVGFLALLVIYLGGLAMERFVFGRVMPVAVLILQLALTEGILGWWNEAEVSQRRAAAVAGALSLSVLAIFAAPALVRMVPGELLPGSVANDERLQSPVDWLREVDPLLGPSDIVLAPPDISMLFPATGAKVVALAPAPFVDDQEARYADATRFFVSIDRTVLDKYQVTWVAFRGGHVSGVVEEEIRKMGDAHELDQIVLVDLRS